LVVRSDLEKYAWRQNMWARQCGSSRHSPPFDTVKATKKKQSVPSAQVI